MKVVVLYLDIQFVAFMQSATDLSKTKIYRVFDMLDVDHSGLIDFDEFYILICILLAVRVSRCFVVVFGGCLFVCLFSFRMFFKK